MFYITTLCIGNKYQPILNHWIKKINEKCKNHKIIVFNKIVTDLSEFNKNLPGYIWLIRLKSNIDLLLKENIPIVMCDIDCIIEKDIINLLQINADIIISQEIGGKDAYPHDVSKILGFGCCCGFMILKPNSKKLLLNILSNMKNNKYNTYDDQVNLMKYIIETNNYEVYEENIILDNINYINKIIHIKNDNIKICVLDFNIIVRDPIYNNNQFANHINVDNVGGPQNFIKYFYEDLEKLPLTCRCGKIHLGDNNICTHIRNKISILMPIYNGIEFLKESLPTILYQTYKNWELIIGINGHSENSVVFQEAKKYENEKIKVLDLYTIKGKSQALNEMLKYTKYNWIALLDVDDKWLPKKLESQIQFINNYDIIGTMCKYFGDLQITPRLPVYNISQFNFLQINPIINSSVLIRKELCWWDKNHNGVEDYDLWLKLWRQDKKFYNVPEIQVFHRIHKSSAFNSQGNNLKVGQLKQKYIL